MARVLIAAASEALRRNLRLALELDGHESNEVVSALERTNEIASGAYALLILDVDSETIGSNELRDIGAMSRAGIIAVVRDGSDRLRIEALNAGADDYLTERFVSSELLARVRALLRRTQRNTNHSLRIHLGDRNVDLQSHEIQGPGDSVGRLTPKEYLVFRYLLANSDRAVTNQDLANAIWRRSDAGDFEYVRIVISQLRRKLEENADRPRHIVTERSIGYRFVMHLPVNKTGSPTMAQSEDSGGATVRAQFSSVTG